MRPAHWISFALMCLLPGAAMAANPGHAEAPTVAATTVFKIKTVATLNYPWAMVFLPDGRLLVTQKSGELRVVDTQGVVSDPIPGLPSVSFNGQTGLLDVALHPKFAENRLVYLSYAEPGPGNTSGLAVGRGRFVNGVIKNFEVIFRDGDKVGEWQGHMAGRLVFGLDGLLYVSSGERQMGSPAQSMTTIKGKVLRLTSAGRPVKSNPFLNGDAATDSLWTLGHRNPLGMALDLEGRLWLHENGPQGGDELNLVTRGANYGWPIVSNGTNYGDGPGVDTIPDHDTHPEFAAPRVWWNPSVAPSGLMFYSGAMFPAFNGNAFLGSLAGSALIRVTVEGEVATESVRYDMGTRIREVEQGPDGAIWVMEDSGSGRLMRLTPRRSAASTGQ